jgi:L-lactate dehydrogenase complex protein LldG
MESQPDTPVDPLDTSRARDAIFARIRNAQHRPAQPTQGERDAVADYLARHPAGPRPPVQENLAAHFAEQALKMASTAFCSLGLAACMRVVSSSWRITEG